MSNLYKQWFVQTDSTNTRIIDSNVILQQHLKQDLPQTQKPAQNVQEEEGGFSAGLVTGDPGQVIKAEPQIDYEAKAKAKAEEILAAQLVTIHNLRFSLRLMEDVRQAIREDRFGDFARELLEGGIYTQ